MSEEQFEQCIRAITEGNRDGLRQIYEEYHPWLYSVIYGVLRHRERAEDVAAELFLRIWRTALQYKPGKGHKGYLATIARNMAIDELRKYRHEVYAPPGDEGDEDTAEFEHADDGPGPEAQTVQNISVSEALSKLNEKERDVVSMKILSDMTFQEISDATGIPMGTVTWRYQAAMRKLKKYNY